MRFAVLRQNTQQAETTVKQLAAAGFGADQFDLLSDAVEAIADNAYDLILTESRLPDGNIVDWLRSWSGRHRPDSMFVMVLAEKEDERVAVLEAGADDSASLTLSGRELLARVRAVLRRPRERAKDAISFGNVSICTESRTVMVAGAGLSIQRRETAILEALLRRSGNVVPREALDHDIYGLSADHTPNSLEVRISRLRRYLSQAGASLLIETVRGVGYRLVKHDAFNLTLGQTVHAVAAQHGASLHP